MRYLKPYTLWIVIAVVLIAAQCITQLLLPDLMSNIIDKGVLQGDTNEILSTGATMLLVSLAGMVCSIAVSFFAARIGSGFGRDLRSRVFSKVESFSVSQFDEFSTASLITRSTNDITQVSNFTIMLIRIVIAAPMTLIGGLIMGGGKSGGLTWILLAVMPILGVSVGLILTFCTKLFKLMQKKLDRLNLVMREGLTGVRVIRAFDRDARQGERFNEANKSLTDTATKAHRIMSTMFPLMTLLMSLTQLAIVWFSGEKIDAGAMSLGDMMAYIQYAVQILSAFVMFGMIFMQAPRASASGARIAEVLDSDPDMRDPLKPVSPERLGTVSFENVTFRYPGAEQPTLQELNFSIGRGQTLAVIGGTGSGKSTIANLVLRFFDPSEGSVRVDGVDLRDMTQSDLRARIGYVSQTAKLLTGSVMDNIRFGSGDISDEEAEQAARTAQAYNFITRREGGFEAEVAQSGANLSGGQKQRVSIARAIARKPEILIFDDSFSALDFRTDANLRAALKTDVAGTTIVVIAQRINTIVDADRILVLDEGRVVGDGTHAQLLKNCAIYREIAESQLGKEAL